MKGLTPTTSSLHESDPMLAEVAEGRIERAVPFRFSADKIADVGVDEATPVTEAYKERDNEFTSKIDKVTVDVK